MLAASRYRFGGGSVRGEVFFGGFGGFRAGVLGIYFLIGFLFFLFLL